LLNGGKIYPLMNNQIKRIAITGPESTGKSVLTGVLSNYFQAIRVNEYARDYLSILDCEYTYDDVLYIAKKQIDLEIQSRNKGMIIFNDTELINIKIWLLHKYGRVPEWLDNEINKQLFDLYLLCNVDLPWEADPLRENPSLRQYFFDWFVKELTYYNCRYVIVSRQGELRSQNAIREIQKLLNA